MYKKLVGIFVVMLLIATAFTVGGNYIKFKTSEHTQDDSTMNKAMTGDPPDEFVVFFPNPIADQNITGSDVAFGRLTGHVCGVIDTKEKENRNDYLDYCDNVIIKWKRHLPEPPLTDPYVTYHVREMEAAGGDGWYVRLKYQSDGKVMPFIPPDDPDEERKHWFVDGRNINGPWDGTPEHPFQYIQDGIDATDPGEIVYVFPGTYSEHLLISEHDIAVVPANFDNPIIDGDGSGSVVTITSDWVILHGFRIINSGALEEDAGIDVRSDNTTIFGNFIQGCQSGIYYHDSANSNEVFENNIQENVWGVFISENSDLQRICNNNFIENTGHNAVDYCNNNWYSEFYGGNYWDDYIGTDSDGDGIGDTPYSIPGGSNQDTLPLINPWENSAPKISVIDGPNSGKPEEELTYSFVASDLDNHDSIFEINWGDGINSTEFYFYDPGEDLILNHTWSEEGTYTIKAKAKDYYGAESEWATLELTVPKNKAINTPSLRFLEYHPHMFPLLRQLLGLQ